MLKSVKGRILTSLALFFFFIIATSSILFSLRLTNSMRERVAEVLVLSLKTAGYSIDGDSLPSLTPEEAASDRGFAFWEQLSKIAEDFGLAYLYIMRPSGQELEFVIDTGDNPRLLEDDDNAFTIYGDAPEEAFLALERGEIIVTREPYTDEWGTFLSAFGPVFNSAGRVAGIIGTDRDISAVNRDVLVSIITSLIPIVIGTLVLGFFLGLVLQRIIVRPIKALSSALEDISTGEADLTKRLSLRKEKEIAALAGSYNNFIERMNGIIKSLKISVDKAVEVKQVMTTSSEETAASVSQIDSNLDNIEKNMTNLETRIKGSLNFAQDMSVLLKHLKETAQLQKHYSEESFLSVETMISQVKQIAVITEKRVETTLELKDKSRRGGEEMGRTAAVVGEIHKEIETISEMLKLINNISAQTNLLAMNASIEAAHAGMYGRGFAVVADEIRKLADNSNRNAKKISEAIKLIIAKIKDATLLSEETKQVFMEIDSGVDKSTEAFGEIKKYASDLSSGSETIRSAMEMLKETAGKVSSTAEKVSSESEEVLSALSSSNRHSEEVSKQIKEINQGAAQISLAMQEVSGYAHTLGSVTEEIHAQVDRFITDTE